MWNEVKTWLLKPSEFTQLQRADAVVRCLTGIQHLPGHCRRCNSIWAQPDLIDGDGLCPWCSMSQMFETIEVDLEREWQQADKWG